MSAHLIEHNRGLRVLLCVTGGVSAYKAAEVLRSLKESGSDVTVVATDSALAFVGEATWAALSGKPVARSMWQQTHDVPHVSLARWADVIAVVPATADAMARIASGRADDLVASLCLMAASGVIMFPAMHTEMWEHLSTSENVTRLRSLGIRVVAPDTGRLTGPDTGVGRLGEPASIAMIIRAFADPALRDSPQAGRRVVITAGGTREDIDSVRVITNKSSGLMGYACAAAAVAAGAEVVVIAANVSLPNMAGVAMMSVSTHTDLSAAVASAAATADVVIMAAAVSDYAPVAIGGKIKKTGSTQSLQLQELPDILAGLGSTRAASSTNTASAKPAVLVGFAAETATGDELEQLAGKKLRDKGCDLIIANDVSGGAIFGDGSTSVLIVDSSGATSVAEVTKEKAAVAVITAVAARLG